MTTKLQQFQQLIDQSSSIVFFGGAGVSTASGIPDFRSDTGLFAKAAPYPPEVMLSHSFFQSHTAQFYDYYRSNFLFLDAQPNPAHYKLAELEQAGKLSAILTQNCDGLHQKAGSQNVLELHGSVHRNSCQQCHKSYPVSFILETKGIPTCTCGGVVKPDVVLYEESLDPTTLTHSTEAVQNADLLIVGGTSLTVYPASGFVRLYGHGPLVILNKAPTPYDHTATLLLTEDLSEIFAKITV